MTSQSDCNQEPIFLEHDNKINDLKNVLPNEHQQNLYERVKNGRLSNHLNGLKVFGVSEKFNPKSVPEWYDPIKFQHAQQLFSIYFPV